MGSKGFLGISVIAALLLSPAALSAGTYTIINTNSCNLKTATLNTGPGDNGPWRYALQGTSYPDRSGNILECNLIYCVPCNGAEVRYCAKAGDKNPGAECDADHDGTPDSRDGCVNDPNKISPGQCGCGVADTDTDGDKTADCVDSCVNDPNKVAPGLCGCGILDTDTDTDGTPDCYDHCPSDPRKTEPGTAGCGLQEPVGGAVEDLRAVILSQTGVSFTVPAAVLPTGVTVTLSEQSVASSDFTPAANERLITNVIKLNFSKSLRTEMQMTLRIQIPNDVGPHFYSYVKLLGAPPFGSEFSGSTGWMVEIGQFDAATSTLSIPFFSTAQEISVIIVKKTDAVAARADHAKFLLAAKGLIQGALRTGGEILRGLILSEALAADEICGDGILQNNQECDDGNTIGGDGCASNCRTEMPVLEGWQNHEWAVICKFEDPTRCSGAGAIAGRLKEEAQEIAAPPLGFTRAAVRRFARADLERAGLLFGTSDDRTADNYLIANLVPNGALGEDVLGVYSPSSRQVAVVESVLSEDLSDENTVAHEIFHAVQGAEIPFVRSKWIIEGTAMAVEAATILVDSYEERRDLRFGGWRPWFVTLNSTMLIAEYQVAEFWLEVAPALSYLKELFEHLDHLNLDDLALVNEGNNYTVIDKALSLTSSLVIPDIDPDLSALPDAYLDLILLRNSQPEYPWCQSLGVVFDHNIRVPLGEAQEPMSAICMGIEFTTDPVCPGTIGTKQITLEVAADDSNEVRLLLDGVLYPANTPIPFENNNPRLWAINVDLDPTVSTAVAFSITSDDYPRCVCGDGACNGQETCSSCASDCGSCPTPDPFCGDGSCNGGETCSSCGTDCGECTQCRQLPEFDNCLAVAVYCPPYDCGTFPGMPVTADNCHWVAPVALTCCQNGLNDPNIFYLDLSATSCLKVQGDPQPTSDAEGRLTCNEADLSCWRVCSIPPSAINACFVPGATPSQIQACLDSLNETYKQWTDHCP